MTASADALHAATTSCHNRAANRKPGDTGFSSAHALVGLLSASVMKRSPQRLFQYDVRHRQQERDAIRVYANRARGPGHGRIAAVSAFRQRTRHIAFSQQGRKVPDIGSAVGGSICISSLAASLTTLSIRTETWRNRRAGIADDAQAPSLDVLVAVQVIPNFFMHRIKKQCIRR